MNYTDIKTTVDALVFIKSDANILLILDTLPKPAGKPIIDNYLLTSVIEAVNMLPENDQEAALTSPWIPDLTDGTLKYFLWPDVYKDESKPSGFGLSFDGYANSCSSAGCGSRLLFRSRARAKHVFTQFQALVEAVYLIDKN